MLVTTVQVTRKGVVVTDPTLNMPLNAVLVRIEDGSDELSVGQGGQQSFLKKKIYTFQGCYDIQHDDLLTDTVNINPRTTSGYAYRVSGRAECLLNDHMELEAELTAY